MAALYPSAHLIPTRIGKIQHLSKAVSCGVCCEPLPWLLQSCLMLRSSKHPRALLQKPVCSNRFFLASLRLHRQNSEEFLAYYMGAVRSCPHSSSATKKKNNIQVGCFCSAHFQDHVILNLHLNFTVIHTFKIGGLVCVQLSPFCVHQY